MKRKIILGIIICLIIFSLVLIFLKMTDKEEPTKNTASIVEDIKEYNYTLDDRDTKLFKELFKELKDLLNEDEINYEEYSKLLAKLFIIDFYTLNNKINKYDVGGLEYIDPNIEDNFRFKAQETLYKYIEDNSDKKRSQELPEIKSIEIVDYAEDKYKIDKVNFESYILTLKWDYVKDLEYDTEGIIIFIKDDNGKLQLVEFNLLEE